MELIEIKQRWNDVLDDLESTNRIVWIAFFYARLASCVDNVLLLDFSDATKFPDGHDLKSNLDQKHLDAVEASILKVFGIPLTVRIK